MQYFQYISKLWQMDKSLHVSWWRKESDFSRYRKVEIVRGPIFIAYTILISMIDIVTFRSHMFGLRSGDVPNALLATICPD